MSVTVIGPKDPVDLSAINTTSRSRNWSRGLSPFFVGPIQLYAGHLSKNMENAWQFSKCYSEYVDLDGNVLPEYFVWAKAGWADPIAHRYTHPKGSLPKFSLWAGEKLTYVQARKKIYAPLYAEAVAKTEAFKRLKDYYETMGDVTLWDFDGYNHIKLGNSLKEVINNPNKKMGHAFVLAMLLENELQSCLFD